MNEKLKEYLETKAQLRKDAYEREKKDLLIREGLYDEISVGRGITESQEDGVDSKWDYATQKYEYYKQVPIDITDEEYEELKKVCTSVQKADTVDNSNGIATALTVIAWIIYIGGFIAGIAFGNVEVVRGTYYTYTDTEFSFAIAFVYWAVCLVAGTMFLGFAEIIKLLEAIKRK